MHWGRLFTVSIAWLFFGMLGTAVLADPNTVNQNEFAAQKELVQAKMDAFKDLHQKDVDAIHKRIDDQLSHVSQAVDRFGVLTAWASLVLTVLLIGLGFLGYRNAKSEAKETAKQAAKDWMDEKTKELLDQIVQLKVQLNEQVSQFQKLLEEEARAAKEHREKKQAEVAETLQIQMEKQNISPQDYEKLQAALKMAEKLEKEEPQTSKESFSFGDWNTKAHTAYAKQQWSDAAQFWLNASCIPNAGVLNAAKALFNRALAQGKLDQIQAEITTYDEVIRRFGEAPETALSELVAKALVNKGIKQGELKQSEAAIASFDELINRFAEDPGAALHEQVARALVNKGVAQGELKQFEAEVATYDELIRRFGEAPEAALRELVAKALAAKGVAHGELKQSEAAIASFDELINRFAEVPGAALHEQVARALVNKGFTQRQQNQFETAIATYDEVIRRFGEAPELALREFVARALLYKAVAQGELKQSAAEDAIYDEVIRRFGQAPEAALRELVAEAWNGKGFLKLLLAKACWTQAPGDAQQYLSEALNDLGQAIGQAPQASGMVWGNRAYVRYLQGDAKGAQEDFVRALQAEKDGGKTVYEATLKDLDMHSVAEDTDLRVLLQRLWQAHSNNQQGDVAPKLT